MRGKVRSKPSLYPFMFYLSEEILPWYQLACTLFVSKIWCSEAGSEPNIAPTQKNQSAKHSNVPPLIAAFTFWEVIWAMLGTYLFKSDCLLMIAISLYSISNLVFQFSTKASAMLLPKNWVKCRISSQPYLYICICILYLFVCVFVIYNPWLIIMFV